MPPCWRRSNNSNRPRRWCNNNNNNNKDERERDEDNVVVPVDDRDTAHRRFLPRCPFLSMMVALVVLAIVLSLMLVVDRGPNDDGVCKDNDNTPPSFPYMTGVSLVTDYAVKSSINVRLAKTTIKLQVSNELECGFDPQIDFATSPRTGSCIQIELGGQESSASLPCSTQVTPRVALNHDRA
mmetsp:Transcript_1695/g.3924  ORF Transcript_1695/g.3924 Transcript_1695/m.3924 type:complete len:182 (+) Transcript_1695:951-1496(+)